MFLQYYFDGNEHAITFYGGKNKRIHKHKYAWQRNLPQNFGRCGGGGGGVENARCSADIPNSYCQIYDISRKHHVNADRDELLELIDMSNGQSGQENAFIRDVRTAPEKAVFLA